MGPALVDRAGPWLQRRVVVETAVWMVGVRAEILSLQTAAAPELPFEAGAPLIHAGRGLMPGIGDDGTGCRRARAHSRGDRVGQGGRRESDGITARQNRGVWRVRIQEGITVGLIRVVIDPAAGAEHRLIGDAICKSESRR